MAETLVLALCLAGLFWLFARRGGSWTQIA
jgi:hypothetical protein